MVERLTHPTHPITHDDEYDAIATALTASATYRMVRCEK
jgi:Holliday junction resolvasome RuvABC endonuclease subunit